MLAIKELLKEQYRRFLPARAEDVFKIAVRDLEPGDIAIDCGANVGTYTELLAKTGATIHAFEPDPVAFQVLAARVDGFQNVHLYPAGVSNVNGTAKLYLHEARERDPVFTSTGSSLVASKTNVNPNTFVSIDVVRLADLIEKWGEIKIMKMDIEGHEIEVLNDLLDSGQFAKVARSFVELHDKKNPQLRGSTAALCKRLRDARIDINLAWH